MPEIKIVLKGPFPALKNSKQIFINKKTNKPFITASKEHKEWFQEKSLFLRQQVPNTFRPIQETRMIDFKLVFPDRRVRDPDNIESSILDLLVDVGILKDDSWTAWPNHRTRCFLVKK